jgi:enamine deaminase RidA (YjgF/YER057c/UK114 family)
VVIVMTAVPKRIARLVALAAFMFGALAQSFGAFAQSAGQNPVLDHLNPAELPRLSYLTQVVSVTNAATFLHIAGQTAVNTKLEVVGHDLPSQMDEALKNLDFALKAGGAGRGDLANLRVFFVANDDTGSVAVRARIQDYFRGIPLPAITFVGVPRLVGEGMLAEIEGVAVLRR